MGRSLRRAMTGYVPTAVGMATLAGMILLGMAPAQAATAGHSYPPAAGAGQLMRAQVTADSRAVCAAAKAGYFACMALLRTDIKPVEGIHPDQAPAGYGPGQLQSAYNLPSAGAGNGETVAIVDAYNDPHAEADLRIYRRQFGLPVCGKANGCFQQLNQKGQASPLPPPAPAGSGWDVEESLDVDMVSAICPHCHIILVEANSNSYSDLYAAEDAAAATGAKFVSNSWSGTEYSSETSDDRHFNHPGVAIIAAAGDVGYGPGYPAASLYVTAVGGTTLARDSSVARGWRETAWAGTGSGCSAYETKPTWQTDTGCANRTENDVSADANPKTGVALYDSYSLGGWSEAGGSSVATPIIAATYALGGTPAAGTYPSSYPYTRASGLNDITSGSNATCTPAYLCTAGPGYDGPTGWGTPDGAEAFSSGPYGTISGKVSGKSGPLPGATVTAGTGYTATTNSSGHYTVSVPGGTYKVSARAWGYRPRTVGNVTVSQGVTTTENFRLSTVASYTLSGTVTDGSGHHWPLYASISANGSPGGAVYTNPYTGQYRLTLPGRNGYTLTVKPVYPGYNSKAATVHIGTGNAAKNIQVTVNRRACTAPGYEHTGSRTCVAQPGGLVNGIVIDSNTGDPVNGASVTSDSHPAQSGVSAPTPDDPNLNGGFYWLFASTGATKFTAADGAYTPSTQTVPVAANAVSHHGWSLRAGHLTITPGSISDTTSLGGARTNLVTFSNDGTQPVQVQLAEANGTFTPMAGSLAMGARIEQIAGTYTPDAMILQGKKEGKAARAKPREPGAAPSGAPWSSIASYPTPIMDNAVSYDTSTGNVYSVGGYTGPQITANGYVYSGSTQSWSALPPAPAALEASRGAFINGIVYVVGGWDSNGNASNGLYAYDPPTRTWSTLANLPEHVSAAAIATLNSQLYVVGGCTTAMCSPTSDAVYSYNPATSSWTQEANYPDAVAFGACAGIDSKIVCAGGVNDSNSSYNTTYIYNPATNIWSQGANMPYDDWGMAYAGSGNQLQIADGVTLDGQAATDQAAEYNPATNTWAALPSTGHPEARGGGSCGLYLVGGSPSGLPLPQRLAEVLPGYGACGTEHVPWLSESTDSFTLNPGQSQRVAVTVDSSVLSQPGTYTAELTVRGNSPYQYQPIGITLQANPPATWGKVAGQVTDASTGHPIAGATVQVCTMYDKATGTCGPVSYTLTTSSNGDYQLWLNQGYNPLQIIAAIDSYAPASKVVKFIKGLTTTVNFTLTKTTWRPGPETREQQRRIRPIIWSAVLVQGDRRCRKITKTLQPLPLRPRRRPPTSTRSSRRQRYPPESGGSGSWPAPSCRPRSSRSPSSRSICCTM